MSKAADVQSADGADGSLPATASGEQVLPEEVMLAVVVMVAMVVALWRLMTSWLLQQGGRERCSLQHLVPAGCLLLSRSCTSDQLMPACLRSSLCWTAWKMTPLSTL